jgi:hypothetical protein
MEQRRKSSRTLPEVGSMATSKPLNCFLAGLFPGYGQWLSHEQQENPSAPFLQPTLCYVYAIKAVGTAYVKIGFSNNPEERLKNIQVSIPFPLTFLGVWIVPSQKIEGTLHKKFHHIRTRGEWFKMSAKECQALLEEMLPYKKVA